MRAIVLATLLAAPALAGIAAAQNPEGFKRCGDPNLTLVFMNPDLKMQDDGYVHASGSFFIQFQARGEKAFDIETLKFSFGADAAVPESCDGPEWVTGAYVKNYRADYDWRDGFFIPIDTCLVPDGTYAVALSAYDKDMKELTRYYTKAKVDNGGRQTPRDPCDKPDSTAPWPMVLPGDGERIDGGQGLYVEVAEPIAGIEAFVNGKKLQLAEAQAPARDNDLVPDLGYTKELRETPLANSQAQSRVYGPAFTWDGVLTPGDVVKVRVTDKHGNLAEKVVHLGDPTIGGRATLAAPDFDLLVPETDKTADANGTATFNVTYLTKNAEGLHADLYVYGDAQGGPMPPGVTSRLNPNHVMMGGNEKLDGTVTLIATPDAKPGAYTVVFVVNYLSGAERIERTVPLTFRVDAPPTTDATQRDEVADPAKPVEQEQTRGEAVGQAAVDAPTEEPKESPGLAPALVIGFLACLALARRRRT